MKQYQRSKIPPRNRDKLRPPADDSFVHPFVRKIWVEINTQCTSQEDVAARAGVSSSAMRKWRRGINSPKLIDIEAVLNALGYKIVLKSDD